MIKHIATLTPVHLFYATLGGTLGGFELRERCDQMDIVFHLGAHRNATTSFQACMRANRERLTRHGIIFWDPRLLRKGLFDGMNPPSGMPVAPFVMRRVRGRVQLQLQSLQDAGAAHLLISEENMLGSVRANIRSGELYPAAGERIARFAQLFDGKIKRIVLSVRSLEQYWASALAYGVWRGHALPNAYEIDQIADIRRTWRDVVKDIAAAVPGAEIIAIPFENMAGRPKDLLNIATGREVWIAGPDRWLNRAPDVLALNAVLEERGKRLDLPSEAGRWQPFNPVQIAAMREAYVDDLAWLSDGAGGVATLQAFRSSAKDGENPRGGVGTRGQYDDGEARYVAQAG